MTTIERWIGRFDAAATEGVLIQMPDLSVHDLRLAADCMAFVRDMNKNIEALSKHRPLPIPVVVYDSLDDNLRALAARIKEASL